MFNLLRGLASLLLLFTLLALPAMAQGYDYSGWWWDSEQSGTGYSLEVQSDKAYLVWYLYQDDGQNTWYSSVMNVDGDTMTGVLVEYEGWPLEPGYDGSEVTADEELGNVTLNFTGENNGTITFYYAGTRSQVVRTLERRLVGTADPRNLTGWWWDTSQQGIGWFFEAKNDADNGNVLSVGWYNFREQASRTGGSPRFYITWDAFAPTDTVYDTPLLEYSGGQTLTGSYVEPVNSGTPGNLELNIPADFDGSLDENPDDGPSLDFTLNNNSYHLTRFRIPGAGHPFYGCEPDLEVAYPTGEVPTYKIDVGARFQTPCGSEIDTSSVTMNYLGEAVPYGSLVITNPDSDPSCVEIVYSTHSLMIGTYTYPVEVSVADVYGHKTTYEWSFWTSMINYRR